MWRVLIRDVFDLHRERRDLQHSVSMIDHIALGCNEDVVAMQQESFACAVLMSLVSKELEVDGWRRRWSLRHGRHRSAGSNWSVYFFNLGRSGELREDVAAVARVFKRLRLRHPFWMERRIEAGTDAGDSRCRMICRRCAG